MESVKLTVQVEASQLNALESRVNILKNTPITLKINATGLDAATKDTTALINACARLVEAQVQVTKSENAVIQSREMTKRATEKTTQEELKLERQRSSTEATANRARKAESDLASQKERTAQASEKTTQEELKLERQQEKTATAAKNLEIQQEKTNTAIARGGSAAENAVTRLGNLAGAYIKLAAISAARKGISDAFTAMKDVDTQLTNIQKVTDQSNAAIASLRERAYETASYYGVEADSFLSAAADFSKAGYSNYEALAELATKTQLVGDVTADTATQFLLSADAAYKFGGNVGELSTVLDKANTIENNYATSIGKLAEGIPNVASTAAMAKVPIDELLAALGTITAVTQESGSKASYALRSLILNIVGSVGAEVDEATTVTRENVESLWDVISLYADETLVAAHNAGEMIDPMEAIAALSKAQNENLLTEVQLQQMVTALGGKLRTNQLRALLDNYDMYEQMLSDIKSSAGSAEQEVDTMRNSWESKLNQLKNAWTQFVSHIVETGEIKTALDALTKLVDILDNGFVQLAIKSGLFYAALAKGKSYLSGLIDNFYAVNKASASAQQGLALLTAGENELTAAATAAAEAQAMLSAATAAIAIAVTVALGIAALIRKADEAAEETYQSSLEAAKASEEAAKKHLEQAAALQTLYDKYKESRSGSDEAKKAAEELTVALNGVEGAARSAGQSLEEYTEAGREALTQEASQDAQLALASSRAAMKNELKNPRRTKVTTGVLFYKYGIDIEGSDDYLYNAGEPDRTLSLKNAESYDDLLRYYDLLLAVKAEAESVAIADETSNILNEDDYKSVVDALKILEPLVTEYNEALGTNAAFIEHLNINSQEAFAAQIRGIQGAIDLTPEYKQAYIDTLSAIYPAYAAAAKEANELADANGKAADSERWLIDALYDATGKLDMTAIAALKADSALLSLAQAQAQSALSAAQADYQNLIQQLGGIKSEAYKAAVALYTTYKAMRTMGSSGWKGSPGFTGEQMGQFRIFDALEEAQKLADALGTFDGSSGGRSYSGSASTQTDAALEAIQNRLALAKQELALMKERGDSDEDIIAKERQIQEILHEQAEYLRENKGDQKDILSLSTEWWQYQNDIQDRLNSGKEDQLELEEKILAVQEAQAALANAQAERTIRIFNAKTGQWEWIANQKDVDSAQEALDSAKEKLRDYSGDTGEKQDLIDALLSPSTAPTSIANALGKTDYIRATAGASGLSANATTNNTIGRQMNGNIYQIAGIRFTQEQAESLTLAELARISGNLCLYSSDI